MTSPSQFLFTSSCLYSLNTSGFKYSRWWWWWWWWWWRRWRWVMGMKGKYSTPYRNALTSGMCMLSCHWHIQNSAVCVCVCVCVCVSLITMWPQRTCLHLTSLPPPVTPNLPPKTGENAKKPQTHMEVLNASRCVFTAPASKTREINKNGCTTGCRAPRPARSFIPSTPPRTGGALGGKININISNLSRQMGLSGLSCH